MFSLLTEDYGYGESMDENNIVERDRYGGGSVMIWGEKFVCYSGKTELVSVNGRLSARRYCDEIIIPVVIPVLEGGRADIVQQNNARCHVVRHNDQPVYSRARKTVLNAYMFCLFCENSSISKRCLIKYSEKVIVYLIFSFYL